MTINSINFNQSEKPVLIADFEETPIFDTEEKFYYGEKIRLEAEANAKAKKALKDRSDSEEIGISLEKKQKKLSSAIALEKEVAEIKTALKWYDNAIFDISITDETKIRLLLRKNGVKLPLFRADINAEKIAEYNVALRNFYSACQKAKDIQTLLLDGKATIEDLTTAKRVCRNFSKKACDALTGLDTEENTSKVYSVSNQALNGLIDTLPKLRITKQKDVAVIQNKTRQYIDVQSFSAFEKAFENFIAQELEKLNMKKPDKKAPAKNKKSAPAPQAETAPQVQPESAPVDLENLPQEKDK